MVKLRIRSKHVGTRHLKKLGTKEEARALPPRLKVPDDPTFARAGSIEERELHDEQQVLRTEILMTKGIRNRRQLATLLDVDDLKRMDRYISRVHARWEMSGTQQDHARNRGEGLARLDLIESELWSKLQNNKDDRIGVSILNTVLGVQKQRSEMLGLTPKVIERIGSIEAEGVAFSRQTIAHDRLTMFAQRMMAMIEDRAKTVDITPNEDQPADIQSRDASGDRHPRGAAPPRDG